MNLKQAKRLRAAIRGTTGKYYREDTRWEIRLIPSSKGTSVTVDKGTDKEKTYDDAAIQVRLTSDCPMGLYKRIKARVQANRFKKRKRVLRGVQRNGLVGSHSAVRDTGAARVQPQHSGVS